MSDLISLLSEMRWPVVPTFTVYMLTAEFGVDDEKEAKLAVVAVSDQRGEVDTRLLSLVVDLLNAGFVEVTAVAACDCREFQHTDGSWMVLEVVTTPSPAQEAAYASLSYLN